MAGYKGPLVCLTLAEARTVLPHISTKQDAQEAADKIRVALGSDPAWRRPTK